MPESSLGERVKTNGFCGSNGLSESAESDEVARSWSDHSVQGVHAEQTLLTIQCGGSSFCTEIGNVRQFKGLLDCADVIGLSRDGRECVLVELGGLRRWIAFERSVGGSPLVCIGYQETVGARWQGNVAIGGSNRKVLCWLTSMGAMTIGASPAL